jgi:transposase
MRKGFDGLSGVVRNELGFDAMSGDVYVFFNASRRAVKLLVWDIGTALWCTAKYWSGDVTSNLVAL